MPCKSGNPSLIPRVQCEKRELSLDTVLSSTCVMVHISPNTFISYMYTHTVTITKVLIYVSRRMHRAFTLFKDTLSSTSLPWVVGVSDG